MKAVTYKYKGDSDFFDCLLSYLKSHHLNVKNIDRIHKQVLLLHLNSGQKLIVKNFSSLKKWLFQKKLTSLLKQSGFSSTYEFCDGIPPFEYDGSFYPLIEYIKPHPQKFNFHSYENRKQGLRLLSKFHQATKGIVHDPSLEVPIFNQLKKWEERLLVFKSFVPQISVIVSEDLLREWISWASWSLNGMGKFEHLLQEKDIAIIHGDVAHHNFLRRNDGELCLLDFDLAALAPAAIDYLQYSNRILPSINYNLDGLREYDELKPFLKNLAFLYALAFPTDIFREWNRLFRENRTGSHPNFHTVWKMTVESFPERMAFNRSLAWLVTKYTG
ncbi:aminoglycoside phosphotransferase family protein [Bacillus sp. V5-8f]|uniref:aminoglycoside phosphotransferase family protein n=1 Tax=Bacillus sp. V5-8f TaxID=2053044 RepID=UPI000C775904|nr:aminoglycoside phosphotransferase family protein [Bacillus sp. V5-8f]PLT34572.1 aminoglycoside phosphotransferase [Bacillus sp. V5-8f]